MNPFLQQMCFEVLERPLPALKNRGDCLNSQLARTVTSCDLSKLQSGQPAPLLSPRFRGEHPDCQVGICNRPAFSESDRGRQEPQKAFSAKNPRISVK